jgi:hypothetical protein
MHLHMLVNVSLDLNKISPVSPPRGNTEDLDLPPHPPPPPKPLYSVEVGGGVAGCPPYNSIW